MCAPGTDLALQRWLLDEDQKTCEWIWTSTSSTLFRATKSAQNYQKKIGKMPLQIALKKSPICSGFHTGNLQKLGLTFEW